jgi:hypothetical protein
MMFIPLIPVMSVIRKNDAHFRVNDVNAIHTYLFSGFATGVSSALPHSAQLR